MPLSIPASKSDIAQIQNARKRIAFERARKAPFHAKRLAGIDPAKLDDPAEWRKIPILHKEELRALTEQQFYSEFNLAPRHEIWEYWRSGGSTGKPLFYPRSFADAPYCLLSFSRGLQIAGVAKGDTAHISYPLGIHPVGHMYARVCQAAGVGVNWAGSGAGTPSAVQVQLLRDLRPTVWMGMSSYGIHLANLAEASGIDLTSLGIRRIVPSAEPLSAAKRAKIERSWGAKVFDTFGMTECGLMGAEDDAHDGLRIWTDMFLIEVLNPDTWEPVAEGEIGTLVTTSLWTNHATPFIRWSSGDLVSYHETGKHDGPFSVFPLIRHANRTTGFFKVRGVNINHSEFEDLMFTEAPLNDFKCEIVTVEDREHLRVSFECKRGADAAAVHAALAERIKKVFEVTPEMVLLESGALAREFEGAVKAPRFVDRRT
ncbi:MAG: AMP-binding protein [Rhodospirillaceae bacterium]|nr:AMP-binding protein [Rhodospirillaceae bacterium]